MNGVLLTGETTVGMDAVINTVGSVMDFAMSCFNVVLENPILLFLFAAGLVPLGLRIFRGIKGAAKS